MIPFVRHFIALSLSYRSWREGAPTDRRMHAGRSVVKCLIIGDILAQQRAAVSHRPRSLVLFSHQLSSVERRIWCCSRTILRDREDVVRVSQEARHLACRGKGELINWAIPMKRIFLFLLASAFAVSLHPVGVGLPRR